MFEPNATRHYTGRTGIDYHRSKRRIPEAAFPWVARLRAEKIAPHVAPADVVLEYGVGWGWNLAALPCGRRIGVDVAVELKPEVAARGIEFIEDCGGITDGSVDVVICHHALEHVMHPVQVLTELRRVLKPGGRLLLFVPYEKERRYRRFAPGEPNHHLYSWNVQTLANLVSETGFEVIEARVSRFGYDRFAATQAIRFKLGEGGFRLIRFLLHLLKPAREVRVVARK